MDYQEDTTRGLGFLKQAVKQRNVPALMDLVKLKTDIDPHFDPIPWLTKALEKYEDYKPIILTEMASWYIFKKDNVFCTWHHLKKVTDDYFAKIGIQYDKDEDGVTTVFIKQEDTCDGVSNYEHDRDILDRAKDVDPLEHTDQLTYLPIHKHQDDFVKSEILLADEDDVRDSSSINLPNEEKCASVEFEGSSTSLQEDETSLHSLHIEDSSFAAAEADCQDDKQTCHQCEYCSKSFDNSLELDISR
ncbi:uncharacterized protein LOC111048393 isoform X3 [Nilaparvata lugens]|uniref:uncharacterized protein LOC111048393 isoform X3 n=1 Tax=Nilaparvata lugens TaxID=108931 RepID=UPI00193CD2A2|nr:uncharacterized protein LOC111048393 isoform X3 [Nilaparvata lugens]